MVTPCLSHYKPPSLQSWHTVILLWVILRRPRFNWAHYFPFVVHQSYAILFVVSDTTTRDICDVLEP